MALPGGSEVISSVPSCLPPRHSPRGRWATGQCQSVSPTRSARSVPIPARTGQRGRKAASPDLRGNGATASLRSGGGWPATATAARSQALVAWQNAARPPKRPKRGHPRVDTPRRVPAAPAIRHNSHEADCGRTRARKQSCSGRTSRPKGIARCATRPERRPSNSQPHASASGQPAPGTPAQPTRTLPRSPDNGTAKVGGTWKRDPSNPQHDRRTWPPRSPDRLLPEPTRTAPPPGGESPGRVRGQGQPCPREGDQAKGNPARHASVYRSDADFGRRAGGRPRPRADTAAPRRGPASAKRLAVADRNPRMGKPKGASSVCAVETPLGRNGLVSGARP